MGKSEEYIIRDNITDIPATDYEKTEIYGFKEMQKYLRKQSAREQPIFEGDKIPKIPYDAIRLSKNAKVQEVLKILENDSTIRRITSYSEVHSEWEDSGVW